MRAFRILSVVLILFSFSLASAKTFKTQFIKFELPPNWTCAQEEIDWVCQPDNPSERSEAIVVVVTKAVNEVDDTIKKYLEILKQPRNMRDLLGNSYKSQIKYVRERTLHNHLWVDTLQLGAEIPGFYTRYLASVREKVAALITYSVAESMYPKWAAQLDAMVDSAEIFFDPKAFADAMNASPTSLLGARGKNLKTRMDPKFESETLEKTSDQPNKNFTPEEIGAILLVIAAVGYIIWKRKKG